MTVLLDITLPRALDSLVEEFSADTWRGGRLEAWLFEDEAPRRAAERALASRGVTARIRSAYKPLVHAFLEDIDTSGIAQISIATPSHEAGSARRFRLEAYPLAGLLGGIGLQFAGAGGTLTYVATLTRNDETHIDASVFAPNRLRTDHLGRSALCPCGWVCAWHAGAARPARDEAMDTEFDLAFQAVMQAVHAHPWGTHTPFMDTLEIAIAIPAIERRLSWHDECLSTTEALHEDLYFSILEFFQHHAGRTIGDRTLQPGQIIPEITSASGPAQLHVELRPYSVAAEARAKTVDLDTAAEPLLSGEIAAELAALGGEAFTHRSVQGRPIPGMHWPGTSAALTITAGQHANETTGVVGALRAARRLVTIPGLHFAMVPQDNPDGYALHHRLRAANPRHMHHAARYTALGDDLEARTTEPYYEKAARLEAFRRTSARLHLNLHGYPAHEWTRPLTGYLPVGFEMWSIPKGFFLIMRHHPGLGRTAEVFLRALTARLAADKQLSTFNDTQIKVWRVHAGEVPFPVYDGIPCMIAESDRQATPFQLITEYPDETIYGDAFRLGHTAQMNTVLFATQLLLGGMLDG